MNKYMIPSVNRFIGQSQNSISIAIKTIANQIRNHSFINGHLYELKF